MAAVCANMIDAPIMAERPEFRGLMALPLNLIAMILAHLDDVADLARLCCTCRVLNYMSLPQLYKNLTLTSYDKIRYRDDRPEGCGSASPFSMGLNAVVTRPNVAALVRSFTLRGEWRDDGLEEHARVGRVPDSSMMLNMTVRVAIDRMTDLKTFNWDLNTKLLETAYQGLAKLPKLSSLTIRFPSSRHPRPTHSLPPMPHLRSLKVTHIDPLCYPDDLSTMLFQSKKLRELMLHFSTRMAEELDPSVTLHSYFRKCTAAKSPLRLRKFAVQNFYAVYSEDHELAIDQSLIEDLAIVGTAGFDDEVAAASFVAASWPPPPRKTNNVKSIRFDRLDKKTCEYLGTLTNLERVYMVHQVRDEVDRINAPRPSDSRPSALLTPVSRESFDFPDGGGTASGYTTAQATHNNAYAPNSASSIALRDSFLHMFSATHGARLRHLLLPSRWPLPGLLIGKVVHGCPNLEQLALASEISSLDALGMLIPFLRKLRAVRLLIPTPYTPSLPGSNRGTPGANPSCFTASGNKDNSQSGPANGQSGNAPSPGSHGSQPHWNARAVAEIVDLDDAIHEQALGLRLADKEVFKNLKIMGFGWKAWELGGFYRVSPFESARLVDESLSRHHQSAASGAGAGSTNGTTNQPPPNNVGDLPESLSQVPSSLDTQQPHAGKRQKLNHDPPSDAASIIPPPDSQQNHHQLSTRSIPSSVPQPSSSASYPDPNSQFVPPSRTTDLYSLRNSKGEPLSDYARNEIERCLQEPHAPMSPDEPLWRRKVKRVGWEVLKDWEIWGLDVQEI